MSAPKVEHGREGSLPHRASSGIPRLGSAAMGDAAGKQSDLYLTELLSYSLDRLRKEPELLAVERQQVQRSIQANALSHYPAFISSAQCFSTLQQQLEAINSSLEAMSEQVPRLSSTCEAFSKDAAAVMAQQAQNKQLLDQHPSLLELLEAPQLMDTCVRNGIYDEPLDLAAFINRLALLHPRLRVVQLLLAQSQAVLQTMLEQLLSRLRSNIQLPECLRVVGYLRRMAAFPEPELRLQFLACREAWLSSLVADLDDSDSYEYIKALTDVYRLQLFDVVMQYKAVFFDIGSAGGAEAAAQAQRDTSALYSWVQHRLRLYMMDLVRHLASLQEGGNLASVLEHCSYCSSSLSRVGLDFQGLLQPAYQLCAVHLFSSSLGVAVDAFQQRLEGHKWVAMPTPAFAKSGGAAAAAAAAAGGGGGEGRDSGSSGAGAVGAGKGGSEDASPPYVLMEHVPLAVFTNGVLAALNELRHCALLGLQKPLAALLQAALEQVASTLVVYRHTHPLGDSEAPLFRSAALALSDVVCPYLASCFGRIFPGGASLLQVSAVADVLREVLE